MGKSSGPRIGLHYPLSSIFQQLAGTELSDKTKGPGLVRGLMHVVLNPQTVMCLPQILCVAAVVARTVPGVPLPL